MYIYIYIHVYISYNIYTHYLAGQKMVWKFLTPASGLGSGHGLKTRMQTAAANGNISSFSTFQQLNISSRF